MKAPAKLMAVFSLLLLAATALFVFSGPSNTADHSIANTKAGGLAAFAELLKSRGYTVVMDRSVRPKIRKGDLVIAAQKDFLESISPEDIGKPDGTIDVIDDFLKAGQTVIWLNIPPHLPSVNDGSASLSKVNLLPGKTQKQISTGPADAFQTILGDFSVPIVQGRGQTYVIAEPDGKGISIDVGPGHIATNRFIAQGDNAEVLLGIVNRFAKPGTRIVFPEALFGNAAPSSELDEFGPWANAAKWQFFIFLAVVIWTLSFRFGALMPRQVKARNTHEVLGAMSGMLKKANRRDHALLLLLDTAFDRMRRALMATSGTKPEDLTKMASPRLAQAISMIRGSYGTSIRSNVAQVMAEELEAALQEFEAVEKSKRAMVRR